MSIAETVESVRTVVSSDNLRDALTACMLSASKNATLPVLMAVQVEKRGAELILRSTDRYRLTRVTITLDSGDMPSPDWTAIVEMADVKRIVSALPKARRGASPLLVTVAWLDDGGCDYSGRRVNGLSVDMEGTGVRVQAYDGDYPRMDSLIPSDDSDTDAVGEMGFNPLHMVDLCKMPGRGKGDRVALRFRGDRKGFVSVWGDDTIRYEHLMMPVRQAV